MSGSDWFAVDKEGLASILARRGAWFVVYELIQNAIDEDGVTTVAVTLASLPERRGRAILSVVDDAPAGFDDLTHAFRLFAPSKKKGDAEKRGRFNLGEKLVLAVCEQADIISTKGGYRFDKDGRHAIRNRLDHGSSFDAVIRMTRDDVAETARRVFSILPPAGISLTFNGEPVEARPPVHSFTATLPTEIADDEGRLRPTARLTTVDVFDPAGDEVPMIYEMGIPVVESDDRWHVNVGQKVPLNMDRDNVTPGYLRKLRTATLNEMHARISDDDATATWVKEAIGSPDAAADAVESVVAKLYGADAVVYDPSDPEANKIAAAQGRTVIPSRAFDKAGWANVRATGMFRPAGQVTPSAKVLTSSEGKPPIARDEWTAGMERVAEYAQRVAKTVLGVDVGVTVHRSTQNFAAAYSPGALMLNLTKLGHRWFNEPNLERVDALLIHEFAHHYASDHLSSAFYDACCTVGARMKANAERLTF